MIIDNKYREQQRLKKELNQHTNNYNNDKPTITDEEWDRKYFELQELEAETGLLDLDSPTQSIQYEVVNELNKITHEHSMLSLPKTKSVDEVNSFIGDNKYIMMCKMDGLTCSLTYENGELIRAETRGDGKIGEDILHNAKVLPSIPNFIPYRKKLVIDGEIICKKDDFKEFENEYANPRNFASGSIRLLDSKECAKRKLTFVAWDIIEGFDDDDLYLLLRDIEEQGFTVVPYIFDSVQTIQEEINTIKQLGEDFNYPIDGVVIKYRSRAVRTSLPATAHHAGGALAYKFTDELYPTTLKDIEWTMGRTGVLTPVAVFEPIEIEGSIVERASLHNITVMEEILGGCPSNSDIVYVYKANQIIPQIAKSEKRNDVLASDIRRPLTCPICDGKLEIIESDVSDTKVLMCTNPDCNGKLINKLDHYCGKKGLDIKGLSARTLDKLIEWEWIDSITSLYHLQEHATEWKQKSGFGETSVNKILNAIETASTNLPLESFISALGINLIGKTNSKEICKHIHTYEDFRDKINNKFDFSEYDGIAENKLYYLYNFDYTEYDQLIEKGYVSIAQFISEDLEAQPLENQNIVITGSLSLYKNRNELTEEIEKFGGKVSSSVSKNTTILINNDIESTSAKNKKAKELDIPIMTEQEFFEKYLENF